jgi:hypothetical protein
MMTRDYNIGWPVAYAGFLLGSVIIGWGTYHVLKFFEARAARRNLEAKGLGKAV